MAKAKVNEVMSEVAEKQVVENMVDEQERPQPTLDEVVSMTQDNIIKVINGSGLPISIIKLILENLLYQCK